jgi:Cu2+-containing amine oxidase
VYQIKLTNNQLKSAQEYCKLNNIEDVDKFITKCYTEGFNIKKYGLLGDDKEPNIIEMEVVKEIEVIKEVIKEVPVEIIKEVEIVKYVDREVIKEVPFEKPNDKVLLLQETLQKLRKELTEKNSRIIELEEINKRLESIKVSQGAVYLKGSNINETL